MTTPAEAADRVHQIVEDSAMRLDAAELDVLRAFTVHEVSKQWSRSMCAWLGRLVACEDKRRLFQATAFPPLPFDSMTNAEVAGGLAVTEFWRASTVTPMLEKFFGELHGILIGQASGRLLDAQDAEEAKAS